jgi:uncharacterized protein (TIGR02271 family)
MATMQKEQILRCRGEDLLGPDGEKIGQIQEIYLDTDTGEPEWALVNTGLFGTKSTFVPIRDASSDDDGLRVPYDKSKVKDAPKMDPDGELSQREEAELYRYYGLDYSTPGSGGTGQTADYSTPGSGGTGPTAGTGSGGAGMTGDGGTAGTAGTTPGGGVAQTEPGEATGGDAMTRSEEELRVGTAEREAGRVRLRKYVETEDVQETVPVTREEARVEREPITEANVDDAMKGPEISEDEHEVVLHEEEVVAEKRVEPKERVRLETDTVTDEREVSDTVRKERVEVDDSEQGRR